MPDIIKSPDILRKDRIPPGQRKIEDFPVLHYGDVPRIDAEKWSFEISGLAGNPRKLSYKEFSALPQARLHCDIHCVTGWSKLDTFWDGVPSGVIKNLAAPLPEAKFVIIHGFNNFTTNLPSEEFFQPDVLFALRYQDLPLEPEHGYPVRLVVPRLYFWKSAKWVTGVEFSREDSPGFWESRGYHNHGDPWAEERFGNI